MNDNPWPAVAETAIICAFLLALALICSGGCTP